MADRSSEAGEASLRAMPPTFWTYGVNDLLEDEAIERAAKAFKATGGVRADFVALCNACGVVPHPSFMPPRETGEEDAGEDPTLVVRSMLLDRAASRVLRFVLPEATRLQTLRISGCSLDVEQLGLLRRGLGEACTVTTLHLDWNPLELPHDEAGAAELLRLGAEAKDEEELDELESSRRLRQSKRLLRQLAGQLEALFGSVGEGIAALAKVVDPGHSVTAVLNPLDVVAFGTCLGERLFLSSEESAVLFGALDSSQFQGSDDGLVPLARAQRVLEELAGETEEEGADPLGSAFAGLFDATSPLEIVSLRYCGIGRLELQEISGALGSPTPHLKALNLWGNRICDRGAALLAGAFETNFGLQFLGLGRNLVTHVGLAALCKPLGVTVISDKHECDKLIKTMKEQLKNREKMLKAPPPPKKDASGRERYAPEMYVATCEDCKHPETNQPYWLYTRNLALKTLVLEHNPITDAAAVRRLLPYGCGDLVLRNTPCASSLRRPEDKASPEAEATVGDEEPEPPPPFRGAAEAVTGWRLVLQ